MKIGQKMAYLDFFDKWMTLQSILGTRLYRFLMGPKWYSTLVPGSITFCGALPGMSTKFKLNQGHFTSGGRGSNVVQGHPKKYSRFLYPPSWLSQKLSREENILFILQIIKNILIKFILSSVFNSNDWNFYK